MRLPRWQTPASAPADQRVRWERYIAALRDHEHSHLDHGRGAQHDFRTVAQGVTAATCTAAEKQVREHFDRIVERYRQEDLEYDRRTSHGRTQGA